MVMCPETVRSIVELDAVERRGVHQDGVQRCVQRDAAAASALPSRAAEHAVDELHGGPGHFVSRSSSASESTISLRTERRSAAGMRGVPALSSMLVDLLVECGFGARDHYLIPMT